MGRLSCYVGGEKPSKPGTSLIASLEKLRLTESCAMLAPKRDFDLQFASLVVMALANMFKCTSDLVYLDDARGFWSWTELVAIHDLGTAQKYVETLFHHISTATVDPKIGLMVWRSYSKAAFLRVDHFIRLACRYIVDHNHDIIDMVISTVVVRAPHFIPEHCVLADKLCTALRSSQNERLVQHLVKWSSSLEAGHSQDSIMLAYAIRLCIMSLELSSCPQAELAFKAVAYQQNVIPKVLSFFAASLDLLRIKIAVRLRESRPEVQSRQGWDVGKLDEITIFLISATPKISGLLSWCLCVARYAIEGPRLDISCARKTLELATARIASGASALSQAAYYIGGRMYEKGMLAEAVWFLELAIDKEGVAEIPAEQHCRRLELLSTVYSRLNHNDAAIDKITSALEQFMSQEVLVLLSKPSASADTSYIANLLDKWLRYANISPSHAISILESARGAFLRRHPRVLDIFSRLVTAKVASDPARYKTIYDVILHSLDKGTDLSSILTRAHMVLRKAMSDVSKWRMGEVDDQIKECDEAIKNLAGCKTYPQTRLLLATIHCLRAIWTYLAGKSPLQNFDISGEILQSIHLRSHGSTNIDVIVQTLGLGADLLQLLAEHDRQLPFSRAVEQLASENPRARIANINNLIEVGLLDEAEEILAASRLPESESTALRCRLLAFKNQSQVPGDCPYVGENAADLYEATRMISMAEVLAAGGHIPESLALAKHVLSELEKLSSALKSGSETWRIASKFNSIFYIISLLLVRRGSVKEARFYLNQALKYAKSQRCTRMIIRFTLQLAELDYMLGNFEASLELINSVEDQAGDVRSDEFWLIVRKAELQRRQKSLKSARLTADKLTALSTASSESSYLRTYYSSVSQTQKGVIEWDAGSLRSDAFDFKFDQLGIDQYELAQALVANCKASLSRSRVLSNLVKRLDNSVTQAVQKACAVLIRAVALASNHGPSFLFHRSCHQLAYLLLLDPVSSENEVGAVQIAALLDVCKAFTITQEMKEISLSGLLPNPFAGLAGLGPADSFISRLCTSFQEIVETMPGNMTVVSITYDETSSQLFLSRIRNDGQVPVTAAINIPRTQELLSYQDCLDEFNAIIAASRATLISGPGCESPEAKKQWWRNRRLLDRRLEILLARVELEWLGVFRGIFLPRSDQGGVEVSREQFTEMAEKMFGDGVRLSSRMADILFAGSTKLKAVDYERILEELCEMTGHELSPADRAKALHLLRKCASSFVDSTEDDVFLEQATGLNSVDEIVILMLDKNTQMLPWENIPCLQGRSVCRVPSTTFLHNLLQKYPSGYVNIESAKIGYVLNPSGDLKQTQSKFEGRLRSFKNGKGIVGEQLGENKFVELLSDSSLFIYFGHGGGEMFAKGSTVRMLKQCAPTLLVGCSSGRLKAVGEFEPSGTALNYLLGNCPTLLANLWDVTDKDIDRFADTLLEYWGLWDKNSGPTQSLPQAAAIARHSCSLRFLNGAAPVIYGLPAIVRKNTAN